LELAIADFDESDADPFGSSRRSQEKCPVTYKFTRMLTLNARIQSSGYCSSTRFGRGG
jgi:hypothetical protein